MKAVRELKREFADLYERKNVDVRDVVYVFGKVREVLENRGEYKSEYPKLNLFCNWCAHSRLSGSSAIYKIILDINLQLLRMTGKNRKERTERDFDLFRSEVSNILNIPELRSGLKSVLEQERIPAFIANEKSWWDKVLFCLLYEISEKTISFPECVIDRSNERHKANKIYKKILGMTDLHDNMKVASLMVVYEENCEFYGGNSGFYFSFKTIGGVTINTPVAGLEDERAFQG